MLTELLKWEELQRRPLTQELPPLLPQWLWAHRSSARWLVRLPVLKETWAQQPLEFSAEDDLVKDN